MTERTVNGQMIVLGRQYRGLTARELASKLNVAPSTLSGWESDIRTVGDEHLQAISLALNLKESFFTRPDWVYSSNLHWRKKAKATQGMVSRAEAEMNVHRLALEQFLRSIEITLKPPTMDAEEYKSPAHAAMMLRQVWNIPKGPMRNLFDLIESHGIVIIRCDFQADIDGRSMFTKEKVPIIFVNRNRPMDRQRFTVAHELAHLIIHTDFTVSDDRDIEKEANLFASEFLMPRAEFITQLGVRFSMSRLADLKRYWLVSMAAILYRARQERIITEAGYKYWWVEFGKMNIRRNEPPTLDPPQENPTTMERLLKAHVDELGLTYEDISDMCGLTSEELKEKYLTTPQAKMRMLFTQPGLTQIKPSGSILRKIS